MKGGRYKECRGLKKRGIAAACIGIFLFLMILSSVTATSVQASGLVDDTVDASSGNLYNRYSLYCYQLDFYVDTSWDWLPWNWVGGIGDKLAYMLYCVTNVVWVLSLTISAGTGYIMQEAFRLDFISDMAEGIGTNIQILAGISADGISSEGFYPGFMLIIILVVGLYMAYTGLIKHEAGRAFRAGLNMVVIFIVSAGFIAYAPDYIRNINEFSSDISTGALTLGARIVMPGSTMENQTTEDAVDLMRDSLFSIQVYEPWLILQFGTSDEDEIGRLRILSLLGSDLDSDGRETAAETEIESFGNMNLTVNRVMQRFGNVLLIFLLNFIISIFVLLMTGFMLLTQVLFIVYAMFLPISFVLAMFPTYERIVKKAVMKVFNIIMQRAGITLMVVIALSISSMLYQYSSGYVFIMTAFLQIVVFAGVWMKMGELLEMVSLQDTGSGRHGNFLRSMGRYTVMRRLFYRGRSRGGYRKNGKQNDGRQKDKQAGGQEAEQEEAKQEPESAGRERRYKAAEHTPGIGRHVDKDGVVSDSQTINETAESMEKYRGKNGVWRRERGFRAKNQPEPKKRLHAAEKTPELKWHVRDDEAVADQSLNVDRQSMDRYRSEEKLRQRLKGTKVKETVEPEQMIQPDRNDTAGYDRAEWLEQTGKGAERRGTKEYVAEYNVAGRSPGLAPYVDGEGVVVTEQRLGVDAGTMGKYRGTENLRRRILRRNAGKENTGKENPQQTMKKSRYTVKRALQVAGSWIGETSGINAKDMEKYRETGNLRNSALEGAQRNTVPQEGARHGTTPQEGKRSESRQDEKDAPSAGNARSAAARNYTATRAPKVVENRAGKTSDVKAQDMQKYRERPALRRNLDRKESDRENRNDRR